MQPMEKLLKEEIKIIFPRIKVGKESKMFRKFEVWILQNKYQSFVFVEVCSLGFPFGETSILNKQIPNLLLNT
jgi:hypothetical protein